MPDKLTELMAGLHNQAVTLLTDWAEVTECNDYEDYENANCDCLHCETKKLIGEIIRLQERIAE